MDNIPEDISGDLKRALLVVVQVDNGEVRSIRSCIKDNSNGHKESRMVLDGHLYALGTLLLLSVILANKRTSRSYVVYVL